MGTIEILTSEDSIIEQLLIIERAGRTCYASYKDRKIDEDSSKEFIKKIVQMGHESVIEHSSLSVLFSGFSRGFSHQVVRHRLCAFSQRSTRYVREDNFNFIRSDDMDCDCLNIEMPDGNNVDVTLDDIELFYSSVYNSLLDGGVKKDYARQYLPIGMETEIVISANFREWRHIFSMRLGPRAHWEIRGAMMQVLENVVDICSPVFDDFRHFLKKSE